ncbi:MAG: ABC transporter ATP-binding protein [Nitrospiraceae bacterium]|nr:ABC transporter ATP-binding protein [Nitrospiraceae bacterium]
MLIKISSINVSYGPVKALKGVSLEAASGEIITLIGSNGSGKSTTLMTVSGILRPDSGDVIFDGFSIAGLPAHKIVDMGISQVPEGRRIFSGMTLHENLLMGGFSADASALKQRLEKVYELFPVFKERRLQLGGTLSGGEQQMLAIARALMSGPRLLLLDEPSLGLSPVMAQKIFKVIKEINSEGVTVLLVEQNAMAALSLCTRGYVLEGGRVKLYGPGRDLINNDDVRKAYLGE